MYSSASLVADNEIEEHAPYEQTMTPFHKWSRKDKRSFVERFCSITVPANQNGSSKNLQLACNCCGKVFRGQLITALVHLAGARKGGQRISICPTPNEELKAEVLHLFSLDHVHNEDALNEEALHIGEHFHHPNMVDIQLQQQHYLQTNNKLVTARDRATAKRKRDYAMKTLSVDPSNPIDVAILRFLADADLKPKILELESFQEMARLLRAAPKNYTLPGINRPEEVPYSEGVYGSSGGGSNSGVGGGVSSNSGGGSGSVGVSSGSSSGSNSGSNMVHTMMQMNAMVHNINPMPGHEQMSHNNIDPSHIHHAHAHAHHLNTHPSVTTTTTHNNTVNPNNTNNSNNVAHAALSTNGMNIHATLQAQHEAHKRARQGYTTSASVEAGVDADSDSEDESVGSVHTIPQM